MLTGKRVAILVAPKFHEEEMTIPRDFLRKQNAQVELVGLDAGSISGKADKLTITPDLTIDKVAAPDYDAIIIPGGGAPERLRVDDRVIEFVNNFWATGKPIAAICHGPQVLISAGVLKGVTLTSYIGIRDDVKNVGGKWVDQPVVVDGQLITSRTPDDLDAFDSALLTALSTGFVAEDEKGLDVLRALELAISREKGAQDFYAGVAEVIKTEKVANKFRYLSTIEETHFDQLSDMYAKISGGKQPVVDPKTASEIGHHKVDPSMTSEQAVELAMRAEQRAYDFYRNASLRAKSAQAREMFEHLAAEELEHKRLFALDQAAMQGGQGHFQWATHFDIPPGMDDLW